MIETQNSSEVDSAIAGVIEQMSEYNHEQVVFCHDQATGLKAIIAIHDTTLGPSLGGTRMWQYNSEAEALKDALRLSRGMTYKSALAGLNLGGGKAVIIGDARKDKSEALFRRFGQFVNSVGGKYITAEDVGITSKDLEYVMLETEYVAGLPEYLGGSGDPSPVTAYGVYCGLKAAVKEQYGSDSLSGKSVMVQGVGAVGKTLVDHLTKDGARVMISDIYEDRLKEVSAKYGAKVVAVDDVYDTPMDIYAPCALGATINDETLKKLTCKVIAGAANNQLADEARHGQMVVEKGISYAPDFVVNAGGIINCYWELMGYHREAALKQTEDIYNTVTDIFKISREKNIPTYLAANSIAEKRISDIAGIKTNF